MRNLLGRAVLVVCSALLLCAIAARAQSGPAATGAIEFVARVTPTAARPEPVRQFTFYLLTKSYDQIVRDAEAADPMPLRQKFIDDLKVSQLLKDWMKAHDTIDLGSEDIEDKVTADDVIKIQEFQDAYMKANSGGVTRGMPKPKYTEAEHTSNPEKYQLHREEYLAALEKFIIANPGSLNSIGVYLEPVNPAPHWNQITSAHRSHMLHRAPEIAQTQFLAAKTDTDLNGHAAFSGIPVGSYWLSSLDLDAAAGDSHLRWDVPVQILAGQTTRLELTNLNAAEKPEPAP